MLSKIITILGLTILAGICIPIGGLLARFEHIPSYWLEQEVRHFIVALGGGILLGAVAIVLVPAGIDSMNQSIWVMPIFCSGGIIFFLIERVLSLGRRESPQMMGMLLDYVPEAIALGGLVTLYPSVASLLAILISLQNLPEGFNTYRELIAHHQSTPRKTLSFMARLVILGPLSGLLGFFFLSEHPSVLGGIMMFASGGILYLIFQDIAPQCRLEKHWAPPLGAVFGFCIAILSEFLVHAHIP